MKININSGSLVESYEILDATNEIEISQDSYEKVSNCPIGHAWKYKGNDEFELVELTSDEILRFRRESECFPYINRGSLWYDTLTDIQKAELRTWYLEWLDVTETKNIPTKPDWLN